MSHSEQVDELQQMLTNAGLEKMTTLRDLQAGMLQALEEVRDRNNSIKELQSIIEDKDRSIADLTRELSMLKAVLENPLSEMSRSNDPQHMKRIAISAAPVDVNNAAGSTSYAKTPKYVSV